MTSLSVHQDCILRPLLTQTRIRAYVATQISRLSCHRDQRMWRVPLRFLWLQASHVGGPVCLGAPVDVRNILGRRPRGLIDVVDGTGRVIPPTADTIAKRRVTGEAVLWFVTFT